MCEHEVTDSIIVLFTRMIKEQFQDIKQLQVVDSIFYLALTANFTSKEENLQRAHSHLKHLPQDCILVVPICAHAHWFVIVFIDNQVLVMDSLSHKYERITRDGEIDTILEYLKWNDPTRNEINYERSVLQTPQQNNNKDCGIYLLLNVVSFLGELPKFLDNKRAFCSKDFRNWFGQKHATEERNRMRQYIFEHPSYSVLTNVRK